MLSLMKDLNGHVHKRMDELVESLCVPYIIFLTVQRSNIQEAFWSFQRPFTQQRLWPKMHVLVCPLIYMGTVLSLNKNANFGIWPGKYICFAVAPALLMCKLWRGRP